MGNRNRVSDVGSFFWISLDRSKFSCRFRTKVMAAARSYYGTAPAKYGNAENSRELREQRPAFLDPFVRPRLVSIHRTLLSPLLGRCRHYFKMHAPRKSARVEAAIYGRIANKSLYDNRPWIAATIPGKDASWAELKGRCWFRGSTKSKFISHILPNVCPDWWIW